MDVTALSFSNMHLHGPLLANLLRARFDTFVVKAGWTLPHCDGMEFDQYDTPASRWIAVHDGDTVLAGIRLTPTTARCGMYSYMIRDAQLGLLYTISPNLLYDTAPVSDRIFESSRIFVTHHVQARDRLRVQALLMTHLIETGRALGAQEILGLTPVNSQRWSRRIGIEATPIGPVLEFKDGTTPSRVFSIKKMA